MRDSLTTGYGRSMDEAVGRDGFCLDVSSAPRAREAIRAMLSPGLPNSGAMVLRRNLHRSGSCVFKALRYPTRLPRGRPSTSRNFQGHFWLDAVEPSIFRREEPGGGARGRRRGSRYPLGNYKSQLPDGTILSNNPAAVPSGNFQDVLRACGARGLDNR
ncbi:hypothetical protein KM043_003904 [Ampulex compressa]|nr:hypothetical protein KM043_003904 [Ampulex compressa]